MSPQEAVAIAKGHVADLFAAEGAANLGLEELRYDELRDVWEVTIGFSREWELSWEQRFPGIDGSPGLPRVFKTVEIRDADQKVLGLKHWPVAA